MLLNVYPLTADAPEISPAPRARQWLSTVANPNRCLPMTMANQSGWWVLNPAPFQARCTDTGEIEVAYDKGWKTPLFPAKNHFGKGILTIDLPFLWRTEPGWNLHIGGPANLPLPGAFAFEGILESDWASIPIPSNWQIEPGRTVRFEKDFPVAQVVPVPRQALEKFEPKLIYSTEGIKEADQYYKSRQEDYAGITPGRKLTGYFQGQTPNGQQFDDHEVNVKCQEFKMVT